MRALTVAQIRSLYRQPSEGYSWSLTFTGGRPIALLAQYDSRGSPPARNTLGTTYFTLGTNHSLAVDFGAGIWPLGRARCTADAVADRIGELRATAQSVFAGAHLFVPPDTADGPTTAGRRPRRVTAGGAALLCLYSLGGCGASSTETPRSLVRRADAICTAVDRQVASADARVTTPPGSDGRRLAFIHSAQVALPLSDAGLRQLRALRPPRSLSVDWRHFLADVETEDNGEHRLLGAAEQNDLAQGGQIQQGHAGGGGRPADAHGPGWLRRVRAPDAVTRLGLGWPAPRAGI